MPFLVPIEKAKEQFPNYKFIEPLTPSEQKAAFHVTNAAGQHLCLKIIAPSCRIDRVEREILALGKLEHKNVVKLKEYTFSTKDGVQQHFMVEEFIAGTDLAAKIVPGQPMALSEAKKIFNQLADGLECLRLKQTVHRDLKPTNVRLRTDGTPVIIDFGLARHLDLPDLTATLAGAGIGTPMYFAPEQAEDGSSKRNIEHRTDLFALGVILYQALVGRHPFTEEKMSLREAICKSTACLEYAGFKALPEKWRLIVSRLLEKDRVKRPHSAGLLSKMLQQIEGT